VGFTRGETTLGSSYESVEELRKDAIRKSSSPSPRYSGERGSGGEGLNRLETRPLTPALSPAKPGAREDIFVSHRISSKHTYCLAFKVSSDQRWGMRSLALFTNEQLAQMVQRRCRTKSELLGIEGVGEAKIDKYAERLLLILTTIEEQADASSSKSV